MLTRTKVLELIIAALLILTLAPGPATAGAPVRGPALAAGLPSRAIESLKRMSDSEAYFTDFSAPAESSMVQDSLTPLSTATTTRVSVASDGSQGNDYSFSPSISANGRYVAFRSYASNLIADDTNGQVDIFVHDQQTGQTTRVSVASDGGQGNNGSWAPSISAGGRYVAFWSYASNLVGGDTNGKCDIFVHDGQTGQTSRVSVASDGGQGNSRSYWPSISAGGRYVTFHSEASNLVGGDTNGVYDIFVHDRGDRPGPPTGVIIAGPTTGFTQTGYIFIATVSPVTTTLLITYTWEATGQSPVTNTSGLNDTVTFTWSTIGSQAITVTATNVVNAVTGVHVITISPVHKIFLPLILRNY